MLSAVKEMNSSHEALFSVPGILCFVSRVSS